MPFITDKNILIHIGFHKTASTFLQTQYFSRSEYGYHQWPVDQFRVHELFIKHGPYASVSEEVVDEIRMHVNAAASKGLTYVLSHERLSGHPASGGYDSRLIADRLNHAMPNARILIVIREQQSIIRSSYSQYVTEGGPVSLHRFLNSPTPIIRRAPFFEFSYFDYVPCVEHYQRLFGSDRVLTLPYEMFSRTPKLFLEKIATFANSKHYGIPNEVPRVNTRQNQIVQTMRRYVNRLFRSQFNNAGLLDFPGVLRCTDRSLRLLSKVLPGVLDRFLMNRQEKLVRNAAGDRYADGNRRLSTLIGIDLAEYGYQC